MKKIKEKNTKEQNIVIYKGPKGNVSLKMQFERDTVWATQAQIALLFDVDRTVVTKHIKNIFKDKELEQRTVCANFAHTAQDGKIYQVQFYNLDIILAVGYRTNSLRAIMFRRWVTKTLREYIIKGVAINTDRIKNLHKKILDDLGKKIQFIQETINKRQLERSEVDSLLSVIHDYANSWATIQKYDEGELKIQKGKTKEKKQLIYNFARLSIDKLKESLIKKSEASELFGNERDGTFDGILKTIYQTFGGKELYESLEEKAAHLLYFMIKDHPFSDGNKRIGSFLFILFLEQNKILLRKNNERKINDNALVALALLIAESNPKDKDQMVALVTQLLK